MKYSEPEHCESAHGDKVCWLPKGHKHLHWSLDRWSWQFDFKRVSAFAAMAVATTNIELDVPQEVSA